MTDYKRYAKTISISKEVLGRRVLLPDRVMRRNHMHWVVGSGEVDRRRGSESLKVQLSPPADDKGEKGLRGREYTKKGWGEKTYKKQKS